MNAVGYDVAIPGNHEFDYGMDRFLELTEMADFPYISANFNKDGELVFDPYVIEEIERREGCLRGHHHSQDHHLLHPQVLPGRRGQLHLRLHRRMRRAKSSMHAVQSAVDAAIAEGADYVMAMAPPGQRGDLRALDTYADVIANTTGIDAFLDGHSHDTDQVVMQNKDGEDVPRSGCGTKMDGIGYARISAADGSVQTGLYHLDQRRVRARAAGH